MKSGFGHGSLIKLLYIKDGFLSYYICRQAVIYIQGKNKILEDFLELEIEYFDDDEFSHYSLTTWEAVFFKKCINDASEIPEYALEFVERRWLDFEFAQLPFTPERINLLSIYLLWTEKQGKKANFKRASNILNYIIQNEILVKWIKQNLAKRRIVDIACIKHLPEYERIKKSIGLCA